MFNDNKYTSIYTRITSGAKHRTTQGYTERHHIIPQSLGGSNDKENLVDLTAREHFICHWLLLKMVDGAARGKMLYALHGMKAENRYQERYSSKITSRVYEKYRIEHAANHSKTMKGRVPPNKGRAMSDEQKQKLRKIALARPPMTSETKEKMRQALLGKTHSVETKMKQSLALKGKHKGPMSEEGKRKRSLKQTGIPKSKSHSANVAAAMTVTVSLK